MMMREEKKREKGRGGGEGGAGWGSRRSPVALSLHPPHPTPWPFFGSLSFFFFRRATTTRATATRAIPTRAASTRCEEEEGACARARERGKADGWTGREREGHTHRRCAPPHLSRPHAPTSPPKKQGDKNVGSYNQDNCNRGDGNNVRVRARGGAGHGGEGEKEREGKRGVVEVEPRAHTHALTHTTPFSLSHRATTWRATTCLAMATTPARGTTEGRVCRSGERVGGEG